jgi:hypothetical protein
VENSFWKRMWTCRKTDYRMNDDKTQFLYKMEFVK